MSSATQLLWRCMYMYLPEGPSAASSLAIAAALLQHRHSCELAEQKCIANYALFHMHAIAKGAHACHSCSTAALNRSKSACRIHWSPGPISKPHTSPAQIGHQSLYDGLRFLDRHTRRGTYSDMPVKIGPETYSAYYTNTRRKIRPDPTITVTMTCG